MLLVPTRAGAESGLKWSRVRTLEPGTKIVVKMNGSSPATRYFIAADDSAIVLLNVTVPLLPREAIRALRHFASQQTERLATIQRYVLLEDRVRVGPDGVFVANQKVAAIDDVVETVARKDIVDIEPAHRISTGDKIVIGAAVGIAAFIVFVHLFIPYT